jgi:hypothetical protein
MVTEKATGLEIEIVEHVQGSIWCVGREADKTAKRVYRLDELDGEVKEACDALYHSSPWDQQQIEQEINTIEQPEPSTALVPVSEEDWKGRAARFASRYSLGPSDLVKSKFKPRTVRVIARELGCEAPVIIRLLACTMNRGMKADMVIPGHFVEMVHKMMPILREAWMRNGGDQIKDFDNKYRQMDVEDGTEGAL